MEGASPSADEGAVAAALAAGRQALVDCDWEAARAAFGSVLEHGGTEALDGYGLSIWFLGEIDEGMELRQRACVAYGEAGDCDRAARLAAWISHQHLVSGRVSLSNGWLERAERMLEGRTLCSGAGWVAVERARRSDVRAAIEGAGVALELGRACRDDDLEVFALSVLGSARVAAGEFEPGMALLEEAMAAATAGRIGNPHTLGEAYCNLIAASTSAGDWERASEWCELVDRFATRGPMLPLYGACRTIHADVLLASGRWPEAEASLSAALAALERHNPAMGAPTVATLAQLRVRQGRLADAEELLDGLGEQALVLLARAELRLAQAEPTLAAALLERGLAGAGGDVLLCARLDAVLVEAHIAAGRFDAARKALAALEELANGSGRALVAARARLAAARLARAEGDAATAQEHSRTALEGFGRLGMPHEAAEARLELARSLGPELAPLAVEEARAAQAVFRQLGAARSADLAAATLRDLGAGSAPGARTPDELTAREQQVLELLRRGLTNAEIGRELFISEKTAGHHVSRILGKLGVRNRSEAAAVAARRDPHVAPRSK